MTSHQHQHHENHRYCAHNHLLNQEFPPSFSCDACNRSYKAGTEAYCCASPCFYHICLRCYNTPTCRGNHVLKLGTVAIKFMCDLCHKVLPAGSKAHSCRNDNFDICTSCFEKQSEMKMSALVLSKGITPQRNHTVFSPSSVSNNGNDTHQRQQHQHQQHSSFNNDQHEQSNFASIHHHNNKESTHNNTTTASTTTTLLSPPKGSKCKSLFVGCNYYRTKAELRGSINDVFTSMKLLRAVGFDLAMTKVLVDERNFIARTGSPDRRSIEQALQWLIEGAKSGDHLFFHFAGHATQVQQQHQQSTKVCSGENKNGYDSGKNKRQVFLEAIVPVDYERSGVISDQFLFENLFTKIPTGCRLTCIFDTAVYSATFGADLEFEWKYDEDLKRFKQTRRSATQPEEERMMKLSQFRGNNNTNTTSNHHQLQHLQEPGDIVVFSTLRDALSMPAPEGQDIADYTNNYATKTHPGREISGGIAHALVAAIAMKIGRDGKPHVNVEDLVSTMQKVLEEKGFKDRVLNIASTKKLDFSGGFSVFGRLPV